MVNFSNRLLQKKQSGLIISSIGLALSIHLNVYLGYLLILYPILYLVFNKKIDAQPIVASILVFIFLLSTFLIAELKFRFIAITSLLSYLLHQSSPTMIADNISNYIQSMVRVLYYSFFSFNNFIIFLIFIFFLFYIYKTERHKKNLYFLYIWLFSTLPLFAFRAAVVDSYTIHTSVFGAVTVFFAGGIVRLMSTKKLKPIGIMLLFLFLISNLYLFAKENYLNNKLLAYQLMLLKDEKKLIDYTYLSAGKSPFSICSVSNPLFINTLWSTLYKIYGEKKYGYLPVWAGQKQYLNKSYLDYDTTHVKTRYLIIEPEIGIPLIAKKATIYAEDQVSILEEEKKFGDLIIQKRRLENNKQLLKSSQNLSLEEIQSINITNKIDPRYTCFIDY